MFAYVRRTQCPAIYESCTLRHASACTLPTRTASPPTAARGSEYAGERKSDRQAAAHGNCAGFFADILEIASANGYNRLKHMLPPCGYRRGQV